MPEIIIKKKGWKCLKCNHEWVARDNEKPIVCPNCKNPRWDMEAKKK